MSKARALLVGLKSVDPAAYNGWDGTGGCWGCELDVDNVHSMLKPLGYQTTILKTAQATRQNILNALDQQANDLVAGDIFVFYFSGHGGQQYDSGSDEYDGKDETLIAYDAALVDDDLDDIWRQLEKHVRVVMLSDSCNSGTNYRMAGALSGMTPFRPIRQSALERSAAGDTRDAMRSVMKAQMIHYGGCRDGHGSTGYTGGGAFTIALCNAWANGQFSGNYKEFHTEICDRITTSQKPQLSEYGPVASPFRNQKPFCTTPPISTILPSTRVSIQAKNGMFLCADSTKGGLLVADREKLGPWELFDLIDLGNHRVALRAHNGRFVCAEEGGGRELIANRPWIRSWETFQRIHLGGDRHAWQVKSRQFLCAEGGGGGAMIADRWWIRSWEHFSLQEVTKEQIEEIAKTEPALVG